jgi:hypothetical protein
MNKYIITRTDGKHIPADEPCFVIRGQDKLAAAMVMHYLVDYELLADIPDDVKGETCEALQELGRRMAAWPKKKWAD